MSLWEGKELPHEEGGVPHCTKIKGKPVSQGVECKCSADAESGIMLRLEIQEGAASMRQKKFQSGDEQYPFHTAVTLRAVEPWHRSHRLVVADSAFSSVATAIAMLQHGLHFAGIVKTAYKGFPVDEFKRWEDTTPKSAKGEAKAMTTNVLIDSQEHKLLAVDWRSFKMKRIIATCSNLDPGMPHMVQRTCTAIDSASGDSRKVRYMKEVPRPKVVQLLFDNFSAVDVHNHSRQGTLALERSWKTNAWWHRVFVTVLGVIYTDCFLAYKLDCSRSGILDADESLSYPDFLEILAKEMISNDLDETISRMQCRKHAAKPADEQVRGDPLQWTE